MKQIVLLALFVFPVLNFAQIAEKAEAISPLLIGEEIPNVILHDVNNNEISTNSIFNKKTVLIYYRGGWCPYCNSQLADIQDIEAEIIKLGYQVVAISPDSPKFLNQTLEDKELQYQLFSDSEGVFAQALGIAFKREKPKLNKYSEGKNPGFMPVPTVYIVNENAEIEFMYINPNYSVRLSGKMLLAVLNTL